VSACSPYQTAPRRSKAVNGLWSAEAIPGCVITAYLRKIAAEWRANMAPPIRAASIPPIAQARRAAVQRIFDGRSLVLAVDTNVLVYAADADSQFHAAKVPSAQSAASAPVDPRRHRRVTSATTTVASVWSARPQSGRFPSQPTVLTVLTQNGLTADSGSIGDALETHSQFDGPNVGAPG
jgi:hypothetical protein